MTNVTQTSLTLAESCFLGCIGIVAICLISSLIYYWIQTILLQTGVTKDDWNDLEK